MLTATAFSVLLLFVYDAGCAAERVDYRRFNFENSRGRYGGGVTVFGRGRGPLFAAAGKKAFGIASGPGFAGGAVAGIAAMETYHRYMVLRSVLVGGNGWLDGRQHPCVGPCPFDAFCDYGVCRCLPGYDEKFGHCFLDKRDYTRRDADWSRRLRGSYEPFPTCTWKGHDSCVKNDMNQFCNNFTRTCECREGMRWNEELLECQLYLDVDCTGLVEPPTTPAPANKNDSTTTPSSNSTTPERPPLPIYNVPLVNLTAQETLARSRLPKMDVGQVGAVEVKRQFCEEVKEIASEYRKTLIPQGGGAGLGALIPVIIALAVAGAVGCAVVKFRSKVLGCFGRNGGELPVDGPD